MNDTLPMSDRPVGAGPREAAAPGGALRPWRAVVAPHPDVASGRYRQARFAVDLAQVLAGKAAAEYQEPAPFFARTHLTEGMLRLLQVAVERVAGRGGEPVVQLKTAFGGGKTHALLTLYHLAGSRRLPAALDGVPAVLQRAGVATLPAMRVAALVGTALDPNVERLDAGGHGVVVRTLWGELAAQLGGATGYARVAAADRSGVAPGSDTLVALLDEGGPCIVLIDELVAYARKLHGVEGLPGGSFDSTLSFVQSLTEAARRSRHSILVAAIPEADTEVGAEAGREALQRLERVFGRLEAVWRPVGPGEDRAIVRRRLFGPLRDSAAAEQTCRAYSNLYATAAHGVFPAECGSAAYVDRLRGAYPLHPELFARLDDWASLERFQGTRGVLRLVAAAVHALWDRRDPAPLIQSGTLPLDAPRLREGLLDLLPPGWEAVLDGDVDGEPSTPRAIDADSPRFGEYAAARRVARTIFLGSAAGVARRGGRGPDEAGIRLGAVQPGEPIAAFDDALGHLRDRLSHLYAARGRYWYDLLPNLRRTVEDRARRLDGHEVEAAVERRLRQSRERGDFGAVHVWPGSEDVPDVPRVRLVVLSLQQIHAAERDDTAALEAAGAILERRGTRPRRYRNMLVFLAPDAAAVHGLDEATRALLAWQSLRRDADVLHLDALQRQQVAENVRRAEETASVVLPEAYCWLLIPGQQGAGPWTWVATRLAGGVESGPVRAARRLRDDEQLITRWSPVLLRLELDRLLWKDAAQPHLRTAVLWDYLTTYGYLPRLADGSVLAETIAEGARGDYFGYATGVGADGRYAGLVFDAPGFVGPVLVGGQSLIVRPAAARRQQEADRAATGDTARPAARTTARADDPENAPQANRGALAEPWPRRFHGAVDLPAEDLARAAAQIADEIVRHLAGLPDAEITVTLQIEARSGSGFSPALVRIIASNAQALRFKGQAFEAE